MIRSKDEIVFLTKNAMACISVTGAQYPVRDQKLVLLGEDVAVLEEAIRERGNCRGGNLTLQCNVPQDYREQHPGVNFAPSSAISTPVQYDTRILRIRETVDGEYSSIKSELGDNHPWIDKAQAADIGHPGNPIIQCKGSPSLSEYTEALERFREIVGSYRRDLSDESDRHSEALKDLSDAYNKAVKDENDRFANDESIARARQARNESVTLANAAYTRDKASEDARHSNTMASLYDRLKQDELTTAEYDELVAKENERHGFAVEKTANARSDALAKADTDYEVAVIKATDAHYDTLAELKEKYGEDVDKEDTLNTETVDTLTEARNSELTSIASNIPDLIYYVYNNGDSYNNAWQERDKAFDGARITRSCADAFYERYALWKPASTAIDRVYADLEHMNDIFNRQGLTLWRASYDAEWQPHEGAGYVNHHEVGVMDNYNNRLVEKYSDGENHFSNTDFFILYGTRYADKIVEKVIADVVIQRHDLDSHQEERDEILDRGEEDAIAAMEGVDSSRWRWVYNYIELYNTDGMTSEEIENAQAKVAQANEILATARHEAAQMNDEENNTICVSRVEFTKAEDQPHEAEYAILDEIADELMEGLAELAETRDNALGESLKQYQRDMAEAQDQYDRAVEDAEKKRADAEKSATRTYANSMWEVATDINGRLAVAETQQERQRALNDFASANSEKYLQLMEAKWTADREYQESETKARGERRQLENLAGAEHSDRDREIENQYIDAARELRGQMSIQAQERVYNPHSAAEKKIEDDYRAALKDANDEYYAEEEELYEAAESQMTANYGEPTEPGSDRGWWWDDQFRIQVGRLEDDNMRTFAQQINSNLSSGLAEAARKRSNAIKAAEDARWEAIRDFMPLNPQARVKFEATLEPADSEVYGDENRVWVMGLRNVEIIFKPRTETGADFSKYYEELRKEKEEEQGG